MDEDGSYYILLGHILLKRASFGFLKFNTGTRAKIKWYTNLCYFGCPRYNNAQKPESEFKPFWKV